MNIVFVYYELENKLYVFDTFDYTYQIGLKRKKNHIEFVRKFKFNYEVKNTCPKPLEQSWIDKKGVV